MAEEEESFKVVRILETQMTIADELLAHHVKIGKPMKLNNYHYFITRKILEYISCRKLLNYLGFSPAPDAADPYNRVLRFNKDPENQQHPSTVQHRAAHAKSTLDEFRAVFEQDRIEETYD